MSWEKVKNWVFGGGGAIAFILLMGFVDWRVGVKVSEALSAQDLGTDSKIISMDSNIATNTNDIADNKEDILEEKRRLEKVAEILMGE
jgi:hypothetical protein